MLYKKPKATLLHATPLSIGECAARVCYNSFDLATEQTIKDFKTNLSVEDIESSDLLNKLTWTHHHESINEHINLSYYIKDISREVIIEWNRTRIGMATSQQSSRYTMEPVIDAWVDYLHDGDWESFRDIVARSIVDKELKMIEASATYISTKLYIYHAEEPLIKGLKGSKKKKQNDRVKRSLPEVWLLEGLWTFNLRALKHFYELRSSGAAYYGIQEVVETIIKATPKKYLDLIIKPNTNITK